MAVSLTLYQLAMRLRHPRPAAENKTTLWPKRPPGPLLWLEAPHPEDRPVVDDLIQHLTDRLPDAWFLITGTRADADADADGFPDHCFVQPLPAESQAAVTAFLNHWRPDALAWLGGGLRPALIAETAARHIPAFLLDSGTALTVDGRWPNLPGLMRRTLRAFTRILAGDEKAAGDLQRAGANPWQVETIGALESSFEALACNDAERHTLSQLLASRPRWFAASIDPTEYGPVFDAHAQALRRTHRLLLIVTPANSAEGAVLASLLENQGLTYARRSIGEEPEAETQVYIADTEGELGLWYRLASVTFVGGTLPGCHSLSVDPFNAASLGSAVVHGPAITRHQDAFRRLGRADAARQVADTAELAGVIETLLAPDKVAEMAHAAWQVCSAGADVTDQVTGMLIDALAKPGVIK